MPQRAPRLCPRCGGTYRATRCPTCEQRREARQHRDTSRKRGYSDTRWVQASKQYLAEHPHCEAARHADLPEFLRPLARHVDHIDGLGPQGPRGFDPTNWQALCVPCHSSKTAKHDGGFGNRKNPVEPPAPF